MADVTLINALHALNPRVPLGPLYLSAVLERAGFDVDFRDYQLQDGRTVGTPGHFESWLGDSAPVLAISTLSSSLPLVLATLGRRRLRERVETVVLGGPGVNGLGPEILSRFPGVDVVVSGEGEVPLTELMRRLRSGHSLEEVPGLTYRRAGQPRSTAPPRRIDDLDRLPIPAYHKIDVAEYAARTSWDRIPLAVLSARGCPFACTFCDIPGIWPHGIRYRSVAGVVAEVEHLRSVHGIHRFHVADDTFVMDRERVLAFCDAVRERGLDEMPWSCLGRVDRMDVEILERLAEAGCDTIFYGIESGSDEILRRIDKGFTVRQAMDVVRRSTEVMRTHVSFIWGFPFETLDDLNDTIIAVLATHDMGAQPHLNLLVPLPSAELHRRHRRSELSLRAAEIGWDWAMMENYSYGDELLDLIQTHADIFSPFFCFDSPGFAEKVAMLARWGLGSGLPPDAPVGRVPAHVSGPSPAPSRSREHMPRLAAHVALRTVGDETFVLDTRDCILHRPGLRAGGLLHACQRGDTTEDYVALVSGTTGTGTEDVAAYVRRSLAELAKRGFLEAD